MDIELLKTFLEVYRARHFGRAADNLCVTQSAVSARIRQLEEQAGVPLFTRDRNNIQPTDAGRRLLRHAESILTTWNRARLELRVVEDSRTPLVVGAPPDLWDIHAGEWVRGVYDAEPALALNCETLGRDALLRRIGDGSMDIAFVHDAPQDALLRTVKLIPLRFLLVSSEKSASPAAAMARNYVHVDWSPAFAAEHARRFPETGAPAIRMAPGRLAREFLLRRGGSAYLAESMVREDLAAGRLYKVGGAPVIEQEARAVCRLHSERSVIIERILQGQKGPARARSRAR